MPWIFTSFLQPSVNGPQRKIASEVAVSPKPKYSFRCCSYPSYPVKDRDPAQVSCIITAFPLLISEGVLLVTERVQHVEGAVCGGEGDLAARC